MKVYVKTFGCRANQYDSEALISFVRRAGAAIVENSDDADIAVFNSCAVTAEAEADLRQSVRRAARTNHGLRTIVTGCAAARSSALPSNPIASLPNVEAVIGGADLAAVAEALRIDAAPPAFPAFQAGARALLRIQDGCDSHCTFCATTLARGASRSRAVSEVVEEARMLAGRHAEIVITGIHIGTYGRDTGTSLGRLVRELVTGVTGARFRLSSVEATEVDDELLECFSSEALAPYLHAPLQSGSDRVLKRMGRSWYTSRSYRERIERITAGRAVFGLGADVIAGFPGESEQDHEDTLRLVRELPFTSLHVFPFSPRPGTPAEKLEGRVHPETIRRRAAELRAVARQRESGYLARRNGQAADVVVIDGNGSTPGGRAGLTEDYLSVCVTDPATPRGSRFRAVLRTSPSGLEAVGHTAAGK